MTTTKYKSDLEIAGSIEMKSIVEIAEAAGIPEEAVEQYGRFKAKIDVSKVQGEANGKVVLVTAISPTPCPIYTSPSPRDRG